MSSAIRKKTPNPKQTNSPSFRLNKVDKLKKSEITTMSQELPETQEESRSGDSNGGSVSIYGFDTPQTKCTSLEFEKHKSTNRTCSPSFEVKKSKTIASSEKADKCGYSTQACFSSFKVQVEGNKVPFEKTQDCSDLEVMDTGQFPLENSHLKECGGTGRVYPSSVEQGKPGVSFQKPEHCEDAGREDSCLREFKRLQQRCRELDNEREALTLAIGKDMGLTANIKLLHEYNTIKDITQIIIGSLSNILNIPVTQLHEELNLSFEK
jgi:Swi5.